MEQVRSIAPPAEPIERSIDRAQQLGPPPRRRSRRWLVYSAAAGIAAALLVGWAIWPDLLRKDSERIIANLPPAGGGEVRKEDARLDNFRFAPGQGGPGAGAGSEKDSEATGEGMNRDVAPSKADGGREIAEYQARMKKGSARFGNSFDENQAQESTDRTRLATDHSAAFDPVNGPLAGKESEGKRQSKDKPSNRHAPCTARAFSGHRRIHG